MTDDAGFWQPGRTYGDALRSMSDDVLLEEAFTTHDHLLAANLGPDAEVLAEICRRWKGAPHGSTPRREPES